MDSSSVKERMKYMSFETIKNDRIYDKYIFVSDIHGNLSTIDLIKRALAKYPNAMFVAGGDYIDSRPNSKEVMDFLMELNKLDNSIILRGNHEQLMLNFADGLDDYEDGIEPLRYCNGGKRTIKSFFGKRFSKLQAASLLKETKYYDFAAKMPIMYDTPNIIFVHAGVMLDVPNYDDPSLYPENGFDVNDDPYTFYSNTLTSIKIIVCFSTFFNIFHFFTYYSVN